MSSFQCPHCQTEIIEREQDGAYITECEHYPLETNDDLQCPVCGYYCLGKGGFGCVNKPELCGIKLKGNE